ncbi:SDR family oxidoreductase [Acuticoccus sp. I52.16.1]|uniref:SDR family oxidoreductase n=1 Tax=Acuticoccus sp. I52.16.1 TaxID=2928472 RepID=UPI001FD04E68|nr:SDR family oxidoreductase [Acuticoccus sp. I52.16.1]UOM36584.1 SDR family oxidoreductase [Acuticoccus sp. I52.16.1]
MKPQDWTGATALVTGASSGIGAAIVRALAGIGLTVVGVGRDGAALDALGGECGMIPIACDIRDRERMAAELAPYAVDVLVNNAGVIPSHSKVQDQPVPDIDAMIDVNFRAAVLLTQHCLAGMLERRRGHIAFIGSSAGFVPHGQLAVYGATKAGVSLFAQALRCDLLGTNVRVTEIAPGRVATRLYRDAMDMEAARRTFYEAYEPLLPDDVAATLVAALTMPAHVDLSRIDIFPTTQAVGGSQIVSPDV